MSKLEFSLCRTHNSLAFRMLSSFPFRLSSVVGSEFGEFLKSINNFRYVAKAFPILPYVSRTKGMNCAEMESAAGVYLVRFVDSRWAAKYP